VLAIVQWQIKEKLKASEMKVVYDVVSRKKKATKLNENNKMERG